MYEEDVLHLFSDVAAFKYYGFGPPWRLLSKMPKTKELLKIIQK